MKLRKVISGGQTGADRTGLECAKRLGLETDGTAPKGYRTDIGSDPTLAELGLVEHSSPYYLPRTESNIRDSDATIWFGNIQSPGGKLTHKLCLKHNKPIFINPTDLQQIAEDFEVINVAGNRASTNPAIVEQVKTAFNTLNQTK